MDEVSKELRSAIDLFKIWIKLIFPRSDRFRMATADERAADPFLEVRSRASNRLASDILAKMKPVDRDLKPESNSPYSIGNVLWLTTGLVVFRLAEVPEAVLYDPRKNRLFFTMGAIAISVNVSICLFCVVWLSCVRRVDSDHWEKLYPSAIPVATATFFVGALCTTIGLWPVWGYLTPVILFVLFMGFIVVVAMIPDWGPKPETPTRDEHAVAPRDERAGGEHVHAD